MGLTLQLTLVIFVAVLNSFAQSKDINNGVDELDADANVSSLNYTFFITNCYDYFSPVAIRKV